MVVLVRILLIVLEAVAFSPARVTLSTDSECCIAALARTGPVLQPFFANRVAEIRRGMTEARQRIMQVEDFTHISSALNSSDLGTRSGTTMQELSTGATSKMWKHGPAFLLKPREEWPLQSKVKAEIPTAELKVRCTVLQAEAGSHLGKLGQLARSVLQQTSTLATAQGVLSRVLRAVFLKTRSLVEVEPTVQERELSRKLLFSASSASAIQAHQEGRLLSLGSVLEGGQVWIKGRIRGEDLARMLGISRLPVVMAQEKLAELIVTDAHNKDHRMSPQDVLARARQLCWIPRGTQLAKRVIGRCMFCRTKRFRASQQIMAQLPAEKLASSPPFSVCALDMFGPFKVKDCAKGRRSFKCWGLLFTCLSTKSCALYACPGYSTDVFLTTYRKFTSTYGLPAKVFSDHGSQIIAGVKTLDWEAVQSQSSRKGTDWVFTAVGCSWRDGQAERAIQSARRTLQHLLPAHQSLDFHEMDSALHEVAFILNSRPLGARTSQDGNFYSITPNDILLGRAHRVSPGLEEEREEGKEEAVDQTLSRSLTAQQQLVEAWWRKWLVQCFPELVPRRKWKTAHRNIQPGDVCHIKYPSKFASPTFRLCRVKSTFPDPEGVVRTCQVVMRPRRIGESGKVGYKHKSPEELEVGVQRLAVILPVEEQDQWDDKKLLTDESPASGDQEGETPRKEAQEMELPRSQRLARRCRMGRRGGQ
jgi:hypothetical protein